MLRQVLERNNHLANTVVAAAYVCATDKHNKRYMSIYAAAKQDYAKQACIAWAADFGSCTSHAGRAGPEGICSRRAAPSCSIVAADAVEATCGRVAAAGKRPCALRRRRLG